MSITFSIEGTIYEQKRFDDDGDDACYLVPVSPYVEINLANGNAYAFLESFGLEMDYCGEVALEDIPIVQRRIAELKEANDLTVANELNKKVYWG